MKGISVVICCYNSEKRIKETLEALQAQEISNKILWEVIVVDNNSTDKTSEVSKSIWSKNEITTLKIERETRPGQTYARKTGIELAQYDIISFIDDDNRVCKNWIEIVLEIFEQHPECGACGGQGKAIFEKTEPFWFKHFQNNFAIGPQAERTGYIDLKRSYLYGAGLSIRKEAFQLLIQSGFPEFQTGRLSKTHRGGGEDSELSFCLIILGYKLWYDERLQFDHFMPDSRLTVSGLIELQKGFGRDEVILSIYRSYISTAYKEIHSLFSIYTKTYLRFILSKIRAKKNKSPEESFYQGITEKSTHAFLNELIYYRKDYKRIRLRIKDFVFRNRNIANK